MKMEVFDQPMCCSSGVCGPKVDEKLVEITGDALISFINNERAACPDGSEGPGLFHYLRGLQGIDGGDDIEDGDFVRFAGEDEAAVHAALSVDEAGAVEGLEDFVEVTGRDLGDFGDVGVFGGFAGVEGEVGDDAECIFVGLGEHEAPAKEAGRAGNNEPRHPERPVGATKRRLLGLYIYF